VGFGSDPNRHVFSPGISLPVFPDKIFNRDHHRDENFPIVIRFFYEKRDPFFSEKSRCGCEKLS